MKSVSNPFWTQVLERWKVILGQIPADVMLPFTNICTPSLTLKNYRYIPLLRVTDENFNILPPSELKGRLPFVNWKKISIPLLSIVTARLREKCRKNAFFSGNFEPFIHPLLQITSPNIKGCKEFSKLIHTDWFEEGSW